MAYNQMPRDKRRLTFYSEGINYWSYLEGLVKHVLTQSDLDICFLTSSADDPALKFKHDRFHVFVIDEGYVRDWLFANIETSVFVMTMPDINQYQVKRSKNSVHYVYTQHSLVSLHMVYRPGAFDFYDTIFCSGPHHIQEMRAIEKERKLTPKKLFQHGYARLDSILDHAKSAHKANEQTHYLLAPSWGKDGTIESGLGKQICDLILENNFKVTLRPHPMTFKHAGHAIEEIVKAHATNPNFTFEKNVLDQSSLHDSDVMICDWSGAALDYAFGLRKPVLFIDVPRKVNNPNYESINITPFEVSIREEIGQVIPVDNLEAILKFDAKPISADLLEKNIYNIGKSDEIGAAELIRIVNEVENKNAIS